MSTAQEAFDPGLDPRAVRRTSSSVMAMVLFVLSESMFFMAFFGIYASSYASQHAWPHAQQTKRPARTPAHPRGPGAGVQALMSRASPGAPVAAPHARLQK